MEVRIGILHTSREVVIDSTLTADEISAAVDAAIAANSTVRLSDDKGRSVAIPAATIAYVDIAAADSRKVGFGA